MLSYISTLRFRYASHSSYILASSNFVQGGFHYEKPLLKDLGLPGLSVPPYVSIHIHHILGHALNRLSIIVSLPSVPTSLWTPLPKVTSISP